MSIQSVVGPLVTHLVTLGRPHGASASPTELEIWPPVASYSTAAQDRLTTEFIVAVRLSLTQSRIRTR